MHLVVDATEHKESMLPVPTPEERAIFGWSLELILLTLAAAAAPLSLLLALSESLDP